jgi:hypothetical protein
MIKWDGWAAAGVLDVPPVVKILIVVVYEFYIIQREYRYYDCGPLALKYVPRRDGTIKNNNEKRIGCQK